MNRAQPSEPPHPLAELRTPQLWAVALTFGAITMMWTTYNEYVPQFLRGTFGLPLVLVTFVLTMDNLLGFFLEPVTGLLSDRTLTRWGRRLPWILVIAPLAAASLALLPIPAMRVPPALAGNSNLLGPWLSPFALFVVAMLVAMALFRTPAVALMPDLVASPDRSVANGLLQTFSGAGMLAALLMGNWLVSRYGPGAPFWLASGVMLLSGAILWYLLAGRGEEQAAVRPSRVPGMGRWRERTRLMGAISLWWLGYLFFNTFFGLLAETQWGFSDRTVDGLLEFFLWSFTITSIPTGLLAERWGRRPAVLAGTLLMLGVVALLPLLPAIAPLVIALVGLAGLGWAAVTVNSLPMLLDLGPEGRMGTSTGLYYLSFALAGLAGPWLMRMLVPQLGMSGIWLVPVVWGLTLPLVGSMRRGEGEAKR